ncbi:MAG TPA: hypothetical protein VLS89_06530, partial [Candidatus Nanopelagicales bacterium]|nr:hypothetical protein [Candidatus Nanopelagicales bacterium]
MAKLTALVLSSLAAASLTLAASTSEAAPSIYPAHLDWMGGLVTNIVPSDNSWAGASTPCSINWATNVATTKGACFLTLAIRQGDATITSTTMFQWWGSSSPSSPTYHDQIAAGNRFYRLLDAGELVAGDVLSTKYLSQSNVTTGYTMVVSTIESFAILPDGTERFLVEVIDSATDPHGNQDTRYNIDPNVGHDQGVGAGLIFIDADP